METETQRIVDQILKDSRELVKTILEEARSAADFTIKKEQERAINESQNEVDLILKRGNTEAETIRRTIITEAKQKANWMVLSEQERLVTSVLDEAKRQLVTFSQSERYLSLLQRLIIDGGIVIGEGKVELLLREQDSKLPLNLGMLEKKIKEQTLKKIELKISNERIDLPGCVIRAHDGKIILDNTFLAMLKRNERKLRYEIARILFNNI